MTEERLAMSEQRRIYPLNAMQREMYKDVREHPSVTQYNMTVCVDVPRDKCSPYRMHKACQEVLVTHLTASPATTYRDFYLYCAQHTLGSHVHIVNSANFGNLYITGPQEFFEKR